MLMIKCDYCDNEIRESRKHMWLEVSKEGYIPAHFCTWSCLAAFSLVQETNSKGKGSLYGADWPNSLT